MKAEREMDAHLPFSFEQEPAKRQIRRKKKTIEN